MCCGRVDVFDFGRVRSSPKPSRWMIAIMPGAKERMTDDLVHIGNRQMQEPF
jgi:hypothetical protein